MKRFQSPCNLIKYSESSWHPPISFCISCNLLIAQAARYKNNVPQWHTVPWNTIKLSLFELSLKNNHFGLNRIGFFRFSGIKHKLYLKYFTWGKEKKKVNGKKNVDFHRGCEKRKGNLSRKAGLSQQPQCYVPCAALRSCRRDPTVCPPACRAAWVLLLLLPGTPVQKGCLEIQHKLSLASGWVA